MNKVQRNFKNQIRDAEKMKKKSDVTYNKYIEEKHLDEFEKSIPVDQQDYKLECPICKELNPSYRKYCIKCGHWLLDSNFESKVIDVVEVKEQKRSKRSYGILVVLFILITTALYHSGTKNNVLAGFSGLISLASFAISIITFLIRVIFKKGMEVRKIGFLITIACGLMAITIVTAVPNATNNIKSVSNQAISADDFKKSATTIDYDNLARNAENLKGQKVHLKGIVIQSLNNSKEIRLNMATKDQYGNRTINQLIDIERKDNSGVLLENDEIEIWGIVDGYANQTLVTGQQVTEPLITSYYLNITKKEGSN